MLQLALVFNQLSNGCIRSVTVINAAKIGSVHRLGDEISRDHLRTAPPFAIAHTFRASRDVVRKVPTNPKVFCADYELSGRRNILARVAEI